MVKAVCAFVSLGEMKNRNPTYTSEPKAIYLSNQLRTENAMRVKPGAVRLVLMVFAASLFAYFYLTMTRSVITPYGWGAIALLFFWVVIWLLTGKLNPFLLVIGEDGRPSTSKL